MKRTTTVAFQCLMAFLIAMNQMLEIFPPVVQKYVPFALSVAGAIQAIIIHGYTPEGDKIRKIKGDGEEIIHEGEK